MFKQGEMHTVPRQGHSAFDDGKNHAVPREGHSVFGEGQNHAVPRGHSFWYWQESSQVYGKASQQQSYNQSKVRIIWQKLPFLKSQK